MRSGILKDVRFAHGYSHEFFDVGFGGVGFGGMGILGKRRVHLDKVDDDNFVTRWLRDEGWGVVVQSAREAEIKTVLKREFWSGGGGGGGGFVGQCVRWARTTWRSNWTSLRQKGGVGGWGGYAVLASSFNPPAVVMEGLLWWLLVRACDEGEGGCGCCFWGTVGRQEAMVGFAAWIFLTKTVKLWGHFWRYPRDLKFLPASIAFGYFHGAIKIFTLLTIHWTTWEGGKEVVVVPPVEGLEEGVEKDCLVCGAEEKGRSAENGVRRRS